MMLFTARLFSLMALAGSSVVQGLALPAEGAVTSGGGGERSLTRREHGKLWKGGRPYYGDVQMNEGETRGGWWLTSTLVSIAHTNYKDVIGWFPAGFDDSTSDTNDVSVTLNWAVGQQDSYPIRKDSKYARIVFTCDRSGGPLWVKMVIKAVSDLLTRHASAWNMKTDLSEGNPIQAFSILKGVEATMVGVEKLSDDELESVLENGKSRVALTTGDGVKGSTKAGLKGQMWLAVIDYNKDKRQVTIKPPYASAMAAANSFGSALQFRGDYFYATLDEFKANFKSVVAV